MVAAETPLKMIDKARGTDSSGTRRIVKAADIVQNPPSAAPSRTRPTSSMGKLKAKAAIRFDINRRIVKPSIRIRRSRFRMTAVTKRLEISAKMAVAETVCPAAPSLILKSAAIGVSRLAGRNSAVTRENTPSAIEPTAAQAGSPEPALRSLIRSAGKPAGRRLSRSRFIDICAPIRSSQVLARRELYCAHHKLDGSDDLC